MYVLLGRNCFGFALTPWRKPLFIGHGPLSYSTVFWVFSESLGSTKGHSISMGLELQPVFPQHLKV